MTTLPSFVELMATLGIDPAKSSEATSSRSSPSSPRSDTLNLPASSPTRSRSSPALRDQALRSRTSTRYSPYISPTISKRRGSVSSVSSMSSSTSTGSTSPRHSPSPRIRRRTENGLTINVFGSSTDLPAATPISSYVRRKTPIASPTSSTFSMDAAEEVVSTLPMPFTLPTLPAFLPRSASSDSFPITPDSEMEEFADASRQNIKPLTDELEASYRPRLSSRQHTGIRISTSPRSTAGVKHSRQAVAAAVQVA